jgi:hypothetical protein
MLMVNEYRNAVRHLIGCSFESFLGPISGWKGCPKVAAVDFELDF